MTLQEHFGLASVPFPKSAPDAAIMRHPGVEESLVRLRSALDRDTVATVVAESGCGKSTLLALFAKSLDAANHNVVSISMTTLRPFAFIATICAALGLRTVRFKGETAARLIAHMRGLPRRTVLLVDEAHLLPDDSLEDLRLLTADDLDRRSPFALVVVGQPLLRERLSEPAHYALKQRIGVRVRLRPLAEGEVALFIDRHLKAAGCEKNPFEPDAVAVVFHHSRGIPRLVQNISLDAMLAALAAGKPTVDTTCVEQAVVDMEDL
jgi:type II secretory pathway predicted ATPase ExeA